MIKSYKFKVDVDGKQKTVTVCCTEGQSEDQCFQEVKRHMSNRQIFKVTNNEIRQTSR